MHVSAALDRHDSKTPSLGIARSAVNLVAALTSDYLDIIDKIAGDAIEVGVGVARGGRGLPSAPSSMSSRPSVCGSMAIGSGASPIAMSMSPAVTTFTFALPVAW